MFKGMWGHKAKVVPISPERLKEYEAVIANVNRIFHLSTGFEKVSETESPDDAISKLHTTLFSVDAGHKPINITVSTPNRLEGVVVVFVNIIPNVKYSSMAPPLAAFNLQVCDPKTRKTFPFMTDLHCSLDGDAKNIVALMKLIQLAWLPIVRKLETLKDWSHNISVFLKDGYYAMDVQSSTDNKFGFYFTRYVVLQVMDMPSKEKECKIKFTTGRSSGEITKIITLSGLCPAMLTYLTDWKYHEWAARYEQQHQRMAELIANKL